MGGTFDLRRHQPRVIRRTTEANHWMPRFGAKSWHSFGRSVSLSSKRAQNKRKERETGERNTAEVVEVAHVRANVCVYVCRPRTRTICPHTHTRQTDTEQHTRTAREERGEDSTRVSLTKMRRCRVLDMDQYRRAVRICSAASGCNAHCASGFGVSQ